LPAAVVQINVFKLSAQLLKVDKAITKSLWRQFGASIDMLRQAIELCPKDLWNRHEKFWYISYHCLFWLDYYLTLKPDNFKPPAPFTLSEFDASGKMPERRYRQEEILEYLHFSKKKCRDLVLSLTEETIHTPWVNETKNYTVYEILLYNMRHVQHHAAQLNMILRDEINDAPKWVSVVQEDI